MCGRLSRSPLARWKQIDKGERMSDLTHEQVPTPALVAAWESARNSARRIRSDVGLVLDRQGQER